MSPQKAAANVTMSFTAWTRWLRGRGGRRHEWLARLAPQPNDGPGGAPVGTVGTGTQTSGIEHPNYVAETIPTVERAFIFLDLCGFTSYTAAHGEHARSRRCALFRGLTREIAARRGSARRQVARGRRHDRRGRRRADDRGGCRDRRSMRQSTAGAPWRLRARQRADPRRRRLHRPADQPRGASV